MVLFMSTSNHFILSSSPPLLEHCPNFFFPSLAFLNHHHHHHPRRQRLPCVSFNLSLAKECSFVIPVLLFQRNSRSGLIRRCKSFENEEDPDLEAEILEFMEKSDNPKVFPSKKKLIDAGRMDLVEAIAKQGGWFAFGWESEETVQKDEFQCSIPTFNSQVGSSQKEARVDTGIEGILSRLEKERSMRFGVGSGAKESSYSDVRNEEEDDLQPKVSAEAVNGLERSRSTYLSASKEFLVDAHDVQTQNRYFSDSDGIRSSFKPAMWRKWSALRAGFSNAEFEAADIAPSESRVGKMTDSMDDVMFTRAKDANDMSYVTKEPVSGGKRNEANDIQSRLQNLEAELASGLQLLRSRTDALVLHKGHESSLEELQRLSDDWEFQETTIMKTQDKLRSTRANLKVLEGKMALAISEAQKTVEEKQKKIDGAQRALHLLRTICIIWPSPASEVLLAGSFDGWASQRKMGRSSGAVFSLCLKLYPGRYEIKFIVDGVWKIDRLRPIVHNDGYENNLLIVS